MLPQIDPAQLDRVRIDWTGLPRRYLHPGEMEVLVALVASVRPRTVLEIGCNEGRTAKAILRHVPAIREYIGVEVPVSYRPALAAQRREVTALPGRLAQHDRRFCLALRARGSLDLSAADLPRCDAVFVDGDHGAAAVRHDSALAAAVLNPGGIVIWHDYNELVEVRDVLHDLHAQGWPIQHVTGTWLAFARAPLPAAA